jgi:hypothetical protein
MDSTTSAAERRSAHRRVGAVAIAAFLALLALGATRGPAAADQGAPAVAPTSEPSQSAPFEPPQGQPEQGPGRRDGFRGGPPGGGTAPAPAPDPDPDGNLS